MTDFILSLIAAVGGGLGVVLIILRFSKGLIQKWVETTIETTAEKSIAKYTNVLERRTKAYELLLEKEFDYYACAADFMSHLVLDIQVISDYFCTCNGGFTEENYKTAKETAQIIASNAQVFKRNTLIAKAFLPEEMFLISSRVVDNLQAILPRFNNAIEMSKESLLPEGVIEPALGDEHNIVTDCGELSAKIKERLDVLSKE